MFVANNPLARIRKTCFSNGGKIRIRASIVAKNIHQTRLPVISAPRSLFYSKRSSSWRSFTNFCLVVHEATTTRHWLISGLFQFVSKFPKHILGMWAEISLLHGSTYLSRKPSVRFSCCAAAVIKSVICAPHFPSHCNQINTDVNSQLRVEIGLFNFLVAVCWATQTDSTQRVPLTPVWIREQRWLAWSTSSPLDSLCEGTKNFKGQSACFTKDDYFSVNLRPRLRAWGVWEDEQRRRRTAWGLGREGAQETDRWHHHDHPPLPLPTPWRILNTYTHKTIYLTVSHNPVSKCGPVVCCWMVSVHSIFLMFTTNIWLKFHIWVGK